MTQTIRNTLSQAVCASRCIPRILEGALFESLFPKPYENQITFLSGILFAFPIPGRPGHLFLSSLFCLLGCELLETQDFVL